MAVSDLTCERLRQVLHYEPSTGAFTWIGKETRFATAIRIGEKAGNVDRDGYVRIYIGRSAHKAHRLAWMYVHGSAPRSILDHINGDRTDNRIANLRLATRRLNSQNKRPSTRAASKALGVTLTRFGSYCARIGITLLGRHRQLFLGNFATVEDAHAAYEEAKQLLHPGARVTL